ncbi:hypothetical protein PENTCL1PPCAC_16250, partial [Pristionchus entomophagus]
LPLGLLLHLRGNVCESQSGMLCCILSDPSSALLWIRQVSYEFKKKNQILSNSSLSREPTVGDMLYGVRAILSERQSDLSIIRLWPAKVPVSPGLLSSFIRSECALRPMAAVLAV